MAIVTRLTIDDYERLPDDQVVGYELIDGELVAASGKYADELSIRGLLFVLLYPFVRERRLGTVVSGQAYDFSGDALGPDVSFFGAAKHPLAERSKRVQRFVPDLAIEIISIDDTFSCLMRKKDRYRNCGTAEVWIISMETMETRELLIFSARGDRILREDAELSTDLLPGWRIKVSQLFES